MPLTTDLKLGQCEITLGWANAAAHLHVTGPFEIILALAEFR